MVMMFARVRRLSVVSVLGSAVRGRQSILLLFTLTISTLPASFSYAFGGEQLPGSEGPI